MRDALSLQHETDPEESVEIREQVRQTPEEGRRIQLPQSAETSEEEGVHLGGGGQGGKGDRCRSGLRVRATRVPFSANDFFPCPSGSISARAFLEFVETETNPARRALSLSRAPSLALFTSIIVVDEIELSADLISLDEFLGHFWVLPRDADF